MSGSTPPSPSRYLAYWYQALVEDKGVKIKNVENIPDLKRRLYTARRASHDSQLWTLAIVVPTTNELWIVKKDA